ncbi:hypothetical protein [Streptomyces sp. NPDC029526]|uniref:hypothetical protein n=1 Tax=Streptomyces sp. NPDC029526 TaxID=3155728 RepID=UPI0033F880BE
MIAEMVSTAQHVIVGAVVWVCAATAVGALALAGLAWLARAAVRKVAAAVAARHAREAAWTPAGAPNPGPGDSSAATPPPRPPDARTTPPLWARTQPLELDYGEAA